MLRQGIFDFLVGRCPFIPQLDICTDLKRSNSLCVRCYNVKDNSLKKDLKGAEIYCNPPFSIAKDFVLKLEDAKEQDPRTKVLLIVPESPRYLWFKHMLQRNYWRIIWRFPTGSQLFTRPGEDDIYDVDMRDDQYWTKWPVLALVFNDESFADHKTHDSLAQWEAEQDRGLQHVPGYGPSDFRESLAGSAEGDPDVKYCSHCRRHKSARNFNRHQSSCIRKQVKTPRSKERQCPVCGRMITHGHLHRHQKTYH